MFLERSKNTPVSWITSLNVIIETLCLWVGNAYELQLSFRLYFHVNLLGLSSVTIQEVIFNIFITLEVPCFIPMLFTSLFLAHSQLGFEHLAVRVFFTVYKSAIKIPFIHKSDCAEPVPEMLLKSYK